MKTRFFTFLFLVQLLIPALCQAEFYVIGTGGRMVGTEIKSLPYTIENSGFYYITKNLFCPNGDHGITINTDDVTLDLMGFSLIGPGGQNDYSGIYMNTRNNVEIRNGTIKNFGSRGVLEDGLGEGHRIIDVRSLNNYYSGIALNGNWHLVQQCVCNNNYTGSGIYCYANSFVIHNMSAGNGIRDIYNCSGCILVDNYSAIAP